MGPPLARDLSKVIRELHVEEGEYPIEDLRGAQEAFLASTVREVQPIVAIDGRELPETPGPRTREALDAFAGVLANELDPAPASSSTPS